MLALTNRRRAAGATCGAEAYPPAPPLTEDVRLRQAARAHAADMGARDYFDHQTPEGRTAVDRARAAGYPSAFVGENIAAGYSTPEAVVAGWMKSPGHCTNIMDPRYTRLGVGYASRPASSMRDYWVQDFGH
ncbi:MAG: CAP domain-containing protein [Polyangiaceae bacterium]|nr:CAP domain-containing protein [Polyangiaceae bacterium]